MILSLRSSGLIALASLALAACSSTPVQNTATPASGTAATASQPAKASMGTQAGAGVKPGTATLAAHLDPNSPIYRDRSVYFDFDDAVVKSDGLTLIERQGQYLARNPMLKVRVEGNTDERGGSEYNLALGQRRAEAVKKGLLVGGVKETQIETVSYGKERPKAAGHDEASWAQNRRGDIVYQPSK